MRAPRPAPLRAPSPRARSAFGRFARFHAAFSSPRPRSYALDARRALSALPGGGAGTRDGGGAFTARYDRARALVAALSADAAVAARVTFSPRAPEAAMVHVHVRASGRAALERARDRAQAASGVRVFEKLTPWPERPGGRLALEWSMGPANAAVPEETVVAGYRALVRALEEIDPLPAPGAGDAEE